MAKAAETAAKGVAAVMEAGVTVMVAGEVEAEAASGAAVLEGVLGAMEGLVVVAVTVEAGTTSPHMLLEQRRPIHNTKCSTRSFLHWCTNTCTNMVEVDLAMVEAVEALPRTPS